MSGMVSSLTSANAELKKEFDCDWLLKRMHHPEDMHRRLKKQEERKQRQIKTEQKDREGIRYT